MTKATLLLDVPRRFGFIAVPQWLRATIPSQAVGVYMLLRDEKPFYVGRSDHCLVSRLCDHERLLDASHVVWEVCSSAEQAFRLESAWFHILSTDGSIENVIHPARPAGYLRQCPFCDETGMKALVYMLPHLANQDFVPEISHPLIVPTKK